MLYLALGLVVVGFFVEIVEDFAFLGGFCGKSIAIAAPCRTRGHG